MVKRRLKAFTLAELLIVVVIIGVLAAIIIPRVAGANEEASKAGFVTDLKTFVRAAELYHQDTGLYLEDASSGNIPTDFEVYIRPRDWENGTPVGGVWDAEFNSFSVQSALGVHFSIMQPFRDDDFMLEIDNDLDDGDLDGGAFRKLANGRYYYVMADVE